MIPCVPDLRFKRLHPKAKLPAYGREGDAGLDIFSTFDFSIPPGMQMSIPTGLAVEVPVGYEMVVRGRGGKTKAGVWAFHGTIDSNFREEIQIILRNMNINQTVSFKEGAAFVQVVVKQVPTWNPIWVNELPPTNRTGMFGSSDALRDAIDKVAKKGVWKYLNSAYPGFGCRAILLTPETISNPILAASLPWDSRDIINDPRYLNHWLIIRTGEDLREATPMINSPRIFPADSSAFEACFTEME